MNFSRYGLIAAVMLAVVGTGFHTDADARRFGGARSSGFQRNMPARTAPNAPPAKPATPSQAQQANPGTAGAAAAAPRRSWMGPIAGLAAGLGLAALMSHLGMGEGFANMLMLVLLAGAAFFLIRWVMQRMGGARSPAMAGAAAGSGANGLRAQSAWQPLPSDAPMQRVADPVAALAGSASSPTTAAVPGVTRAFVPATFDAESFTRTAKMIFIRMQAANDSGDLDDLRRFTTPEMYAAVRLDLQERGPAAQKTDVVRVDAEVLDVASEDGRQIVSVRFQGRMVEDGTANDFSEVWHLVRPLDDSLPWAIAGVEQMA